MKRRKKNAKRKNVKRRKNAKRVSLRSFLRKKFRALTREDYRGKQRVRVALEMARKAGYKFKGNPIAQQLKSSVMVGRSPGEERLIAGVYSRGRRIGQVAGREFIITGVSDARAYHKAGAERGRAKKNPLHLLGVTTLANPRGKKRKPKKNIRHKTREVDGVMRYVRPSRYVIISRGGVTHTGAWPTEKDAVEFLSSMGDGKARIKRTKTYLYAVGYGPVRKVGAGVYTSTSKRYSKHPKKNPKRKRKNAKRKGSTKRRKTNPRKRKTKKAKRTFRTYGDLPPALKKKYRKVALRAARRDGCKLDEVPIFKGKSIARAPHGLLHHGDIHAIEYDLKGLRKRSKWSDARYRHEMGDRGRGKKRGRKQSLGVDPVSGQWVPVSQRGARPGFSIERGMIG